MNDHKTLHLAREWAKAIDRGEEFVSQDWIDAAADLISSLPNIVVDGEEIITVYDKYSDNAITLHEAFRDVVALLPYPESAAPRPEDVPVGEPWQVEVEGKEAIGYRNDPGDNIPWVVVYRGSPNFDYLYDSDVTLVARLVPEQEDA